MPDLGWIERNQWRLANHFEHREERACPWDGSPATLRAQCVCSDPPEKKEEKS